jgi:hypothetical protein
MSDQVDNTNTAGNNGSSDESTLRNRKIGFVSGIKKSVKEAGNALMQQRLKSWQPVMSPKYVGIIFYARGIPI